MSFRLNIFTRSNLLSQLSFRLSCIGPHFISYNADRSIGRVELYSSSINNEIIINTINNTGFLWIEEYQLLTRPSDTQHYKLIIYCAKNYADEVKNIIGNAGAGHIGKYQYCSFSSPVTESPTEMLLEKIETICNGDTICKLDQILKYYLFEYHFLELNKPCVNNLSKLSVFVPETHVASISSVMEKDNNNKLFV